METSLLVCTARVLPLYDHFYVQLFPLAAADFVVSCGSCLLHLFPSCYYSSFSFFRFGALILLFIRRHDCDVGSVVAEVEDGRKGPRKWDK